MERYDKKSYTVLINNKIQTNKDQYKSCIHRKIIINKNQSNQFYHVVSTSQNLKILILIIILPIKQFNIINN